MADRNNMSNRKRMKNARLVSVFCPNCFSTLDVQVNGSKSCSGDKLKFWKEEAEKFLSLEEAERQAYLNALSEPDKFLQIVANKDDLKCEYSSNITGVSSSYSFRIPDPLAVSSLEKKLKRKLTEEDLQEDKEFIIDSKPYKLPFVNFPEDL